MITINNVSKKYNDKAVFENLNLSIREGEVTALVGSNGAGKTTLIKCILNLIPYEGHISYSFPSNNIYDFINVQMQRSFYENEVTVLEICNLYKSLLKSNSNINELLKDFDLIKLSNSKIKNLSGGEMQKLSILLTLVNSPKVIIFDEITTGVDPIGRRKIWDHIKKIKKKYSLTILLTSHFLDEVEYLADRIIILDNKKIAYEGDIVSFIKSSVGTKKLIKFSSTFSLNKNIKADFPQITIEQNGKYNQVFVDEQEESKLIEYLYRNGGTNISINSANLETAFVTKFGYRLTEGGDDNA
ncbi:ABC transporter ATP-binding protein [Streptococcus orisasini]|uniref:ABC transporter ATP-binding protein n=1 Tax=Streptococcus orisasini TaxID=1080071 RepID=UPI00070F3D9B|nr:ABC transporter ATP-binding protein [Streptococcus orisasini]